MAQPSREDLSREIVEILQGADLSALSSKKVRQRLQNIFNVDLTQRKKEIDQILMTLIAKGQAAESTEATSSTEATTSAVAAAKEAEEDTKYPAQTSDAVREKGDARRSDSSSDEVKDSSPPVKRKKKKKKESSSSSSKTSTKTKEKKEKSSRKKESKSSKKKEAPKSQANVEEVDSDDEQTINDEELAWKLHQEESRRTRNHSVRKAAPSKNKASSKASSKRENGANKDKGKTGYVADMILSPDLASIIGADRMSRHEVVKRMWEIIKERNLMDPRNKQFHICDDELFKVFGRRRIRTFSMMKYLKGHIKDPRNLTTAV